MAKNAPDAEEDAALDYIAGSDFMCVCSGEPASYADANVNLMLAKVAMVGGDFVKAAGSPSGRKVTIGAKSAVPITNGGTATHVALIKSGDSTLRAVTTCTSQLLVASGTVDVPSWVWNVADPT